MSRRSSTYTCWTRLLPPPREPSAASSRTTSERMAWRSLRFCSLSWAERRFCLSRLSQWLQTPKAKSPKLDFEWFHYNSWWKFSIVVFLWFCGTLFWDFLCIIGLFSWGMHLLSYAFIGLKLCFKNIKFSVPTNKSYVIRSRVTLMKNGQNSWFHFSLDIIDKAQPKWQI